MLWAPLRGNGGPPTVGAARHICNDGHNAGGRKVVGARRAPPPRRARLHTPRMGPHAHTCVVSLAGVDTDGVLSLAAESAATAESDEGLRTGDEGGVHGCEGNGGGNEGVRCLAMGDGEGEGGAGGELWHAGVEGVLLLMVSATMPRAARASPTLCM